MKNQQQEISSSFRFESSPGPMLRLPSKVISIQKRTSKQSVKLDDYLEEFKARFQELIEQHFRSPDCNVDFICRELTCSHSKLYRNIRKCFGCSTSIYLRDYRLSKARELIQNQGNSIAEIARKIGYSDPAYFSRVYSKMNGKSPTQAWTN